MPPRHRRLHASFSVMAGFMPAIHDFLVSTAHRHKSWVAGTSPAMTAGDNRQTSVKTFNYNLRLYKPFARNTALPRTNAGQFAKG
jgi:hypothetical protein